MRSNEMNAQNVRRRAITFRHAIDQKVTINRALHGSGHFSRVGSGRVGSGRVGSGRVTTQLVLLVVVDL